MHHGYTNHTELVDGTVLKRYAGPDAAGRARTEHRMLTALADRFPVPDLVATSTDSVTTRFVRGSHGQDLIDAGRADDVLTECGRVLRELHAIDPAALGFEAADGVIQHGDFGPNNVLFELDPLRVSAVVDWEFSGIGPAITDIAWCEWIVRMHHPAAVGSLPRFFASYGDRPPWPDRRAEMLRRCDRLGNFCREWAPDHPGVARWQARRDRTATWGPLPDDTELHH